MGRVYDEIARLFGWPPEIDRQNEFAERPHTLGSLDVLNEVGLGVAVSSGNGTQAALDVPQGEIFFAGGKLERRRDLLRELVFPHHLEQHHLVELGLP